MMEKVNEIIHNLSQRKYWDIKYQEGRVGRIGHIQTRMEYDRDTCLAVIERLYTILEQYPKLQEVKERLEMHLDETKNLITIRESENQKLKERIESLKKQLGEKN